jgi:hypothetical protein
MRLTLLKMPAATEIASGSSQKRLERLTVGLLI